MRIKQIESSRSTTEILQTYTDELINISEWEVEVFVFLIFNLYFREPLIQLFNLIQPNSII